MKKLLFFLIILFSIFLTGCVHKTYKYEFHFYVEGENGNLEIKDTNFYDYELCKERIPTCSHDNIEQSYYYDLIGGEVGSRQVTFIATPNEGYQVKEWKFNNEIVKDYVENEFIATVSSDDNYKGVISVSFEKIICKHQWNEGIEINRTNEEYVIEYTCNNCKVTKQETFIILPEVYTLSVTGNTEYLKNNINGEYTENSIIIIETQSITNIEVYANDTKLQSKFDEEKDSLLFEFTMPNKDTIIEIKVIKIETEYLNVHFLSYGGTLILGDENQTVTNIEDIEYPVYEKKGYIVDKYNISQGENDNTYYIEVFWKRDPNIFLLEIFLDNELFYMDFFYENEEININLPTKEHYNLLQDIEIPETMPSNDVKVNLYWEIEKVYLYVWYDSDQIGTKGYEYDYGSMVEEPNLEEFPKFSKKGYEFAGWDREFPFVIEETMDLYSIWKPQKFHIIFDCNGGEYLEYSDIYIEYDSYLTLPKTTRKGFKFEGWYYNTELIKNCEWRRIFDGDLTLVAKWSFDEEYYEFGKYPQSHVSDIKLIEELNKLTNVNQNGYYEYNGEEYCKINATPIVENELYYSDGTIITKKIEWFKVEPIKWIVKGTGPYTLSTLKLLDVSLYDIDKDPYSESEIRSYLNNEFLIRTFTKEEINSLIPIDNLITEVRTDGDSVTITGIGIRDKVSINSFNDNPTRKELTDYAIARGASLVKVTNNTTNTSKYYGYWWIIEQYKVSNTVYKQTIFNPHDNKYEAANGTKKGICINIKIIIQL